MDQISNSHALSSSGLIVDLSPRCFERVFRLMKTCFNTLITRSKVHPMDDMLLEGAFDWARKWTAPRIV